ncbi:MAG TPA: hypothetical protein VKT49_04995 [Bryobacteraceae bacterium]|nr:hypothetical protein [Bryobacteraceae bacterium]
MGLRNESFVRFNRGLEVVSARAPRCAQPRPAWLRGTRDAFGLLGAATLLAWMIVKLAR